MATKYDISVGTSSLRSALETLLETSIRFDSHKEAIVDELQQIADQEAQRANALIHQVKQWFSHRLGLDRRGRDWEAMRHDFERMHDLEPYILAPEHAPAVDLYQSPMSITSTPPFCHST